MATHPSGFRNIIFIDTDKINLAIKGTSAYHMFQYSDRDSSIEVSCSENFRLSVENFESLEAAIVPGGIKYDVPPLFYEQQQYEIIIEAKKGHDIIFFHDNQNIRNKVTYFDDKKNFLTGIINFKNEIGFSDLIIKVDGVDYLRVTIEIYPTKIDYKNDYKSITEDVTREVYSLAFDFLKRTYNSYRQGDHTLNSQIEFFAIIRHIYNDFLKAADIVLTRPHHLLETTYEVLPNHKAKSVNTRSLHWIRKHPDQIRVHDNSFLINRALAVKKQITYDTKENRFTKHILLTVIKKLEVFKKQYLKLKFDRDENDEDVKMVVLQIDNMIRDLKLRSNASFLGNVGVLESSAGMSLIFSFAPGYRDLYKYYLMLLRGLSITGEVFHISMKDLALLYEYWCFIKLNSLLKNRFGLVTQDIIKVQGNGLSISLSQGKQSKVEYQNPLNGEKITLMYNPEYNNKKIMGLTGVQCPDSVLRLQKNGTNFEYQYVFDAKYKIDPARPNTPYMTNYEKPGPTVDDINTMHRYRDSIIYDSDKSGTILPYKKAMFGAYILFPYSNEDEYSEHFFYKSIDTVNIGGLPFLPSATKLVSRLLDELITDSPESAFERAILPCGTDDRLKRVDWNARDVFIGSLKSPDQLNIFLEHNCYYIPASQIKNDRLPIRYIALYQSKRLFDNESGIRYYSEVLNCINKKKSEIAFISDDSSDSYLYFIIKKWDQLSRPIMIKEKNMSQIFTTRFLLEHSQETPELELRNEEEYRLYTELKRFVNSTTINEVGAHTSFISGDAIITFEKGSIHIQINGVSADFDISRFRRSPSAVFREIKAFISNANY